MQLPEKGHRSRIGIDSCAAVTVFPKSVADDYPMLDMPGKVKIYRPASGKLLPDLGARKVQVKLRDGSLRYVNPRVADTHRALMAVSEMNDMGHDVFFPRSDRGIKAYAYHESSGTKLELERVNGVFELPVELVPSKNSTSGSYSSLSALEQIEDMMVRVTIVDQNCPGRAMQTSRQCWWKFWKSRRDLPDSRRWTVGRKTSGPRRAREDLTRRAIATPD